jgi:hypothetical protein
MIRVHIKNAQGEVTNYKDFDDQTIGVVKLYLKLKM